MSILNVDTVSANTISSSTGTTALTIDSSGRILTPNRPSFFASSNQGTHTTNVSAVLDFATVQINVGSSYNNGTYRFTAPVAGVYYFHSTIYTQQASTTATVCWRKNGAQYSIGNDAIFHKSAASASDHTIGSSILLNLAVNDFIDLCVRAGSTNLQWYGLHSWFMGYLVS
jgi:hypothetical protein